MKRITLILLLIMGSAAQAEDVTWSCTEQYGGSTVLATILLNTETEAALVTVAGKTFTALYSVRGLSRRFDWGRQADATFDYTITFKANGHGFFFNFTSVSPGETVKSSASLICK